jgi:hypothetical protein
MFPHNSVFLTPARTQTAELVPDSPALSAVQRSLPGHEYCEMQGGEGRLWVAGGSARCFCREQEHRAPYLPPVLHPVRTRVVDGLQGTSTKQDAA